MLRIIYLKEKANQAAHDRSVAIAIREETIRKEASRMEREKIRLEGNRLALQRIAKQTTKLPSLSEIGPLGEVKRFGTSTRRNRFDKSNRRRSGLQRSNTIYAPINHSSSYLYPQNYYGGWFPQYHTPSYCPPRVRNRGPLLNFHFKL